MVRHTSGRGCELLRQPLQELEDTEDPFDRCGPAKASRVMKAMLGMRKLDIAALEAALNKG
ncbi:MAG: hypothetical protein Q8922_01495 [Bacteroidota bacterium]|nr:hypothetical protein [Bacteroidota bacterium]MDP4241194.1 hypothetical protein [Bacteroidota bacterium]MDP4286586.1 hypothetical protein [Bacteroidota bacterium]